MEKFFEAGTLTQEQLVAGLRSATAAGKVFPLLCTSAALNIGVQPLLDAIVAYVPSPAERPIKMVNAEDGRRGRAAVLGERARPRRLSGRPSPIRSPAASRCSASCPAC